MFHKDRLPPREDVIRIDRLETATDWEENNGEFEWRHMDAKYLVNLRLLIKEVNSLGGKFENKGEVVAERAMNFSRIFLIKSTGEIFSDARPE